MDNSEIAQIAQEGGNTKTPSNRGTKYRAFVFTLNNYLDSELDEIAQFALLKNAKLIMGKEVGKCGTPHIQGYIKFEHQVAFNVVKKAMPRAHIEQAKGKDEANVRYCSKEGNVILDTISKPDLKKVKLEKYNSVVWKGWQQNIIDICESQANDRTINWFFDYQGGTGKSFLCKYLWLKYNCIIGAGKKNDIFNQIKSWLDENEGKEPSLVIIDIPRDNIDYFNYGTIEAIKNGLIYSGKYEGGVCCFDSPHVIIFANSEPDKSKFSADRWNIVRIEE